MIKYRNIEYTQNLFVYLFHRYFVKTWWRSQVLGGCCAGKKINRESANTLLAINAQNVIYTKAFARETGRKRWCSENTFSLSVPDQRAENENSCLRCTNQATRNCSVRHRPPSTLSHFILSLCLTLKAVGKACGRADIARLFSVFQQVGSNKFFPIHARFIKRKKRR